MLRPRALRRRCLKAGRIAGNFVLEAADVAIVPAAPRVVGLVGQVMRGGIVGLSMACAASPLWAADAGTLKPEGPRDWTVTIGVEGIVGPRWDGSDRYTVRPSPLFDFRKVGTPARFRSSRDGIGFSLYDTDVFHIGPVGKLRFQRKESDSAALRGLGDVDFAVEIGGFAEYWAAPWLRLRGEVRQGVGGHHGVVSDFAADLVKPLDQRLTLSAGPRVTFASGAAVQPYFGIDAVQSVASGLPVHDAKGGLYSVGAGAQARYQWTPQWASHIFVEYDRLQGDAASSPLVTQRGTANQWNIGAGVTYEFDMRGLW